MISISKETDPPDQFPCMLLRISLIGSFKRLNGAALVSLLTLLKRIHIIRNFEKETIPFHLIWLDYGYTLYDLTYYMSIHYSLKARDNTVQYFSS